MEAFVDAYNRHDLAGIVRLFTPPTGQSGLVQYADCDYVFLHPDDFMKPTWHDTAAMRIKQLERRLRTLFAEGDHLDNVHVFADNPDQPYVGGISANRTSDVLAAMALAPRAINGKWVLDSTTGTWIVGGVWSSYNECGGGLGNHPVLQRSAQPASSTSRGLAEAFAAAYNDRDGGRIGELLARTFSFQDRRYHRSLHTMAALRSWLRLRFRQDDRFDHPVLSDTADPALARLSAASGGQGVLIDVAVQRIGADRIRRIVIQTR